VPRAFIEELTQETCEFSLTFWIRDSRRKREVVDQVYRRISERFQEESIWPEKQSEVKGKRKT
jgi:small-conductance mechanosensitive channel